MAETRSSDADARLDTVLVAGGGIGGLAAALALTRRGFRVTVLEQAAEIGEIGAGIQLGPNAFAAFDALGVGPQARARAVYTDCMVMHDAIDETLVGRIPTDEAFRARFGLADELVVRIVQQALKIHQMLQFLHCGPSFF